MRAKFSGLRYGDLKKEVAEMVISHLEPFQKRYREIIAEPGYVATVLRECRRKQDPPPHLIFFADPIGLVRNLGRDNGGMQFALGLLPSLGVDGLIGAGGAITREGINDESHFLCVVDCLRTTRLCRGSARG